MTCLWLWAGRMAPSTPGTQKRRSMLRLWLSSGSLLCFGQSSGSAVLVSELRVYAAFEAELGKHAGQCRHQNMHEHIALFAVGTVVAASSSIRSISASCMLRSLESVSRLWSANSPGRVTG
eukprot:1160142-Pelagomonas_calceolata.AAC.8